MKRKIYLVLFVLFFQKISINAQYLFPDKKNCEELKKRTLLVKIFDEKSQADITINQAIKEVFNENWKFSPLLFKTAKEIKKMVKGSESLYLILAFGEEGTTTVDFNPADENDYSQFDFTSTSMSLYYLKEVGKKFELLKVTTVYTANKNLVKSDYLFVAQQFNLLVNAALTGLPSKEYFIISRETDSLKSKTLLIPAELLKENEKDKIGSYYKDKFEIIKSKDLEKLILEKPLDKAYVKIIWSEQHSFFVWVAVNANNGKILGLISLAPTKFTSPFETNNIIKIKTLGNIVKPEVQKKTNKYL